MRIKVDYYCCVNLIPLVAVLHRSVFINAISLPHLITEIEMKIYNKKTALALGLCGVFATLPAVAALQSFEVENNNDVKCGYKNDNGKVVVAAKYYSCGDFSEGMARVSLMKMGKVKGYDGAEDYEDYLYMQGYINEAGRLVIPVEHQAPLFYGVIIDYRDFKEGLVAVYKNGKYGYMNKTGKMVIPYTYKTAGDFSDGRVVVSKNDKYGVIDKTGKTIVPFKFNWLDDYYEGLARYNTSMQGDDEGKIGFVDKSGNIAIPAKWDEAMEFSEGLAAVKVGGYNNGKWGVIDKTGKVIIPPKYDRAYIEPMGDSPDVDGGRYEDGKLDVYNLNTKGANAYNDGYDSITRFTLDRQGKVLSKKTYADWNEMDEERYPQNYQ